VPAVALLANRVGQSFTHIVFAQSDRLIVFVFGFYLVRALCMSWMIALLGHNVR